MTIDLWSLALVAIFGGAGAYIGSYLREKGKNLATKEDIAKLTRETEAIKSEISKTRWLDQKRWDLRRDVYWNLLEQLGELAVIAESMSDQLRFQYKDLEQEKMTELLDEAKTIGLGFVKFDAIGRTVLPESVVKALDSLEKSARKIKIEGLGRVVQYYDDLLNTRTKFKEKQASATTKPGDLRVTEFDEMQKVFEDLMKRLGEMIEKYGKQCESTRDLVIAAARQDLLTEGEEVKS